MATEKQTVISFKADESLAEALEGLPNRSEFIREALLMALGGSCPLCRGTGVLSPRQLAHWESFTRTHQVRRCPECHGVQLVCDQEHQRDDGHGCN